MTIRITLRNIYFVTLYLSPKYVIDLWLSPLYIIYQGGARVDLNKEVFNPEEAAEWLGVHSQTVYRLLRSGELPGKKIGQQWRIHKGALEAYLKGE